MRDIGMKTYQLPHAWQASINLWRGHLRMRGLSTATITLRVDHVRSIARACGTAGPDSLTGLELTDLCASRQWSAEHRKGVRASLRSFYSYLVERGLAAEDISLALPAVKSAMPRPRPATDDIWAQIMATAPPRERLMARLAGEAGLRRAEVAQVHRDDMVADGSGWTLIVHGKGGKQRGVPLTASLAADIDAAASTGFLFPGDVDGHMSPMWVGVLISRLMPEGWSMHKLRHRFATRGYAGTGNLRAVQEALGHASVATTQRYTAVSGREIRAVADAAADPGAA